MIYILLSSLTSQLLAQQKDHSYFTDQIKKMLFNTELMDRSTFVNSQFDTIRTNLMVRRSHYEEKEVTITYPDIWRKATVHSDGSISLKSIIDSTFVINSEEEIRLKILTSNYLYKHSYLFKTELSFFDKNSTDSTLTLTRSNDYGNVRTKHEIVYDDINKSINYRFEANDTITNKPLEISYGKLSRSKGFKKAISHEVTNDCLDSIRSSHNKIELFILTYFQEVASELLINKLSQVDGVQINISVLEGKHLEINSDTTKHHYLSWKDIECSKIREIPTLLIISGNNQTTYPIRPNIVDDLVHRIINIER